VTLSRPNRGEREPYHQWRRPLAALPPLMHEGAEGEQVDREEFRRAELEAKPAHHRRKERDHDHRDQRADEREVKAAVKRAAARPCWASGWPSNVVATDQARRGC